MTPQDVRAFFNSHWTVRKYKAVEIPHDHLDVIMHAAQRASTNASAQLYSFIRLRDAKLREEIAQLASNPHMATASETFLVCADFHRAGVILKTRGSELVSAPSIMHHIGVGDAVMAGENLLLAAEMLGYRGCWIGGVLNEIEKISALVKLPAHVIPFAGLTIGVPDEPPVHRPRLERELIFHTDQYREPLPSEIGAAILEMSVGHGEGRWADLMNRYFGPGGTAEKREPGLRKMLEKQFPRAT